MPKTQEEKESSQYGPWDLFSEHINATFKTLHQSVEAHDQFVKSLSRQMDSWEYPDFPGDENLVQEHLRGYAGALQTWMEASEEMFERAQSAMEGEEVDINQFRDIWLAAANQTFQDLMSTSAFAAINAHGVENIMNFKQQTDKLANDTLHEMGFATAQDLDEVAQRLIELERRQQNVEDKLDTILEELA